MSEQTIATLLEIIPSFLMAIALIAIGYAIHNLQTAQRDLDKVEEHLKKLDQDLKQRRIP